MSSPWAAAVFAAAAALSLGASAVLVVRLERLCARLGLSEALLGLVAALAADIPEVTSAVTALARGQSSIGAGVVIGSNVFNLAALLGLSAVVAGRIAFHRRVVLLGGVPGVWVAVVCLLTVAAVVPRRPGWRWLWRWECRMWCCWACAGRGWNASGSRPGGVAG